MRLRSVGQFGCDICVARRRPHDIVRDGHFQDTRLKGEVASEEELEVDGDDTGGDDGYEGAEAGLEMLDGHHAVPKAGEEEAPEADELDNSAFGEIRHDRVEIEIVASDITAEGGERPGDRRVDDEEEDLEDDTSDLIIDGAVGDMTENEQPEEKEDGENDAEDGEWVVGLSIALVVDILLVEVSGHDVRGVGIIVHGVHLAEGDRIVGVLLGDLTLVLAVIIVPIGVLPVEEALINFFNGSHCELRLRFAVSFLASGRYHLWRRMMTSSEDGGAAYNS